MKLKYASKEILLKLWIDQSLSFILLDMQEVVGKEEKKMDWKRKYSKCKCVLTDLKKRHTYLKFIVN